MLPTRPTGVAQMRAYYLFGWRPCHLRPSSADISPSNEADCPVRTPRGRHSSQVSRRDRKPKRARPRVTIPAASCRARRPPADRFGLVDRSALWMRFASAVIQRFVVINPCSRGSLADSVWLLAENYSVTVLDEMKPAPPISSPDLIPLLAVSELHRSLGLADRREAYPR